MKAAVIVGEGESKHLEIRDVPPPQPGPTEVGVAVRAIGVNRADLSLNPGHFRGVGGAPTAPIAGLEMAGKVVATGPGVMGVKVGDRVMAMAARAYAEYATVDYRLLIPLPPDWSWEAAAASPVALMTAHDAVVTNGRMAPGNTVLIQGASTAVGITAVQIAKMRGAKTVIGTSTSPAKLERLGTLGMDYGIDLKREDFAARILELTGDHGADVIIDHIGGSALAGNMRCAAILGRIVNVGRMGGLKGEIDLDLLSLKRLSLIGVTFRTRSVAEIADLIARMKNDLWTQVLAGCLRPPLDRTFPLDEVAGALAYMKSNAHFGKIVLTT
jgi:NADPH2:quinone reductase